MGTARQAKTITRGQASIVEWVPILPLPENTESMSYQTVKTAVMTRLHRAPLGREDRFPCEPADGGGTWVFLGYFYFDKENENKITLSNQSRRSGRIVTADAVKIGAEWAISPVCPTLRGTKKLIPRAQKQAWALKQLSRK